MNITTQSIYTAATAGMFLAAAFFAVNIMLASGQVIRGKSRVSELPTRLIGVGIALFVAFSAWPYVRTLVLDTVGKDAASMAQTLNSLGDLPGVVGDVSLGSDVGLDTSEFSGQSLSDIGTAIMDVISAPAPEPWESGQGADTASEVFKPIEVDGEAATGEMSRNDPTLPPTFPVRVPAPMTSQASFQGTTITPQLQRTVEQNSSWLGFMTDDNGQPLTGAMSQEEPNMSVQSWDDGQNMSVDPASTGGSGSSVFKPLNGGGPTNPPIEPATQKIKMQSVNVYTVARGDTMFKIAKAYYGDGRHMIAICTANPQVKDCNNLSVGEVLVLP